MAHFLMLWFVSISIVQNTVPNHWAIYASGNSGGTKLNPK